MPGKKNSGILLSMLLALGAVLASFLWQGHMGLSTGDEGFLWYGAQRVLLGEVPIRDFDTLYDPGRFYWVAMVMSFLRDNGIISLRIANAIFQFLGLFIGLIMLSRSESRRDFLFLLVAATTLLAWMFPWFKQCDIFITILLIGVLSLFIHRPTGHRYFLMGFSLGVVAMFGRNHAVYGVVGSITAMAYVARNRESDLGIIRGFFIWLTGIAVGYLPLLIMLVLIPGFASAFWEGILALFLELKGTNNPLPVPWPWLVQFGHVSLGAGLRGVLTGFFFIATIAFGIGALILTIRQSMRNRPIDSTFAACSFLALPYVHYIFSRADISHLALGIFPFLIGLLILLSGSSLRRKWSFAALLFCSSVLVMLPNHPGWSNKQYVPCDVAGSMLKIYPGDAAYIGMIKRLVDDYAPRGRSFIAIPVFPSAYAIFKRKSPTLEIYPTWPRNKKYQQAEILRIKKANPGFVVLCDLPLDGRDALRFSNTHSEIYKYIQETFEPLLGYTQDPTYQIFKSTHPQDSITNTID